jgi:uncharacterized protein (TIGR00290 family)
MALHALLHNPEFQVIALLTTVTEGFDRISMHGVRRALLHRQAESIGLPVQEVVIPPQCINATYESRMAEAVLRFRDQGVKHFGFGDIFLADLRKYREEKLMHTGMNALFPLWDINTRDLAAHFVQQGFRATTVCVDPAKLDKSFAGRELDNNFFSELPPGVDPCGENGEFHTFVHAGPIFKTPINVHTGQIVERDSFIFCDLLLDAEHQSSATEVSVKTGGHDFSRAGKRL